MNPLVRWWRFSIVGIGGFLLQMAALALFRRLCGVHYLLASAGALELTLLHNFLWHRRYTWRDRRADNTLTQLARFHLSNGSVSLAGTLSIVRLLVNDMRVGLRAANTAAVLCCAAANFVLGNLWAFARPQMSGAIPLLEVNGDAEVGGPKHSHSEPSLLNT
jgi:putative flippase GtrA